MDYKDLNDYELVYQVRENNDVAYETILKKYSGLVRIIAKKYYSKNKNIGLGVDDFYQEGMIGFLRALDDYDSSNTLFYTYAILCAKRQIETCIRTNQRNKHSVLNYSISFNEPVGNDSDTLLEELIPSEYDIEKDFFIKDLFNKLIKYKYELDFEDSLVFELRLNSFSVSEIASLLCLTRKNVDYRLRRIRKKIMPLYLDML